MLQGISGGRDEAQKKNGRDQSAVVTTMDAVKRRSHAITASDDRHACGGGFDGEKVVDFQPLLDPAGEELVLDFFEPGVFFGKEGKDIIDIAERFSAADGAAENFFEAGIFDGVDETGHDLAFNAVVETRNFKETLPVVFHVPPEFLIFQGGGNKEDFASLVVQIVDPVVLDAFKGIDKLIPDDFNVVYKCHCSRPLFLIDFRGECQHNSRVMRTIFLADAHLMLPDDRNYRMLLAFLRSLEGNTDTLFIMGDLFDFWVGFPSQPFKQYEPLVDALRALRLSGCGLVYFEGNHDFHLGAVFRERLGATVQTGPAIHMVQGRRLFLCHGDQINRADHGYRLLRLILRSRLTEAMVRHFPPALALRVKDWLQHSSRAGYQGKSLRWDYRAIIREFARTLRARGCAGLVTGHFHLAFSEELEGAPFTILSLGDWMAQYTYGEMEAGRLYLRTYPP